MEKTMKCMDFLMDTTINVKLSKDISLTLEYNIWINIDLIDGIIARRFQHDR